MTSCVLFDFAETLAELSPSRSEIVAGYVADVAGLQVSTKSIERAYKAIDVMYPYSSVKIRNQSDREAFYKTYNGHMLMLLGLSHCTDPIDLMRAFNQRKAHWQLKPSSLTTLKQIKDAGKKIGIISNFDSRLEDIVHSKLELTPYIDYLHISQTEGLEKPDTAFYLSFFEKHGLDITASVYVGDSYFLDFLPATKIGLQAYLLDEIGVFSYLPDTLTVLDELPSKIDARQEC
jgi:HAD superfamily hydrolase (TIGR01549 family)